MKFKDHHSVRYANHKTGVLHRDYGISQDVANRDVLYRDRMGRFCCYEGPAVTFYGSGNAIYSLGRGRLEPFNYYRDLYKLLRNNK
jgi:hypothetical protein